MVVGTNTLTGARKKDICPIHGFRQGERARTFSPKAELCLGFGFCGGGQRNGERATGWLDRLRQGYGGRARWDFAGGWPASRSLGEGWIGKNDDFCTREKASYIKALS